MSFLKKIFMGGGSSKSTPSVSENIMDVVDKIKVSENIIVLSGTGISTASGIPDFKTLNETLFPKLERFNLPNSQAVLSLEYFKKNPKPFYKLIKEYMTQRHKYKPTSCHYFQKLLYDKNKLHRIYTQNLDSFEEEAGIPTNKVIHVHGNINSATCNMCGHTYPFDWILDQLIKSEEMICDHCEQFIKPNVVLFGENLPYEFIKFKDKDFSKCDLLIVFGTSLKSEPFSTLMKQVPPTCMRLLIHCDLIGPWADKRNGRFHAHIVDDCESACLRLLELLGWTNEVKNTRQSVSVFPSNLTNLQRSVSSVQYHQQHSFPGEQNTSSTFYSSPGHTSQLMKAQSFAAKPLNYSKSFNYDMRGHGALNQNYTVSGRLKSIKMKTNVLLEVQLHADNSIYTICLNEFRFLDQNNMIVFPSNVSNGTISRAEESYLIDYLSKIVNREVELKIAADRNSKSKLQIASMKLTDARNASYPSTTAIKFF